MQCVNVRRCVWPPRASRVASYGLGHNFGQCDSAASESDWTRGICESARTSSSKRQGTEDVTDFIREQDVYFLGQLRAYAGPVARRSSCSAWRLTWPRWPAERPARANERSRCGDLVRGVAHPAPGTRLRLRSIPSRKMGTHGRAPMSTAFTTHGALRKSGSSAKFSCALRVAMKCASLDIILHEDGGWRSEGLDMCRRCLSHILALAGRTPCAPRVRFSSLASGGFIRAPQFPLIRDVRSGGRPRCCRSGSRQVASNYFVLLVERGLAARLSVPPSPGLKLRAARSGGRGHGDSLFASRAPRHRIARHGFAQKCRCHAGPVPSRTLAGGGQACAGRLRARADGDA